MGEPLLCGADKEELLCAVDEEEELLFGAEEEALNELEVSLVMEDLGTELSSDILSPDEPPRLSDTDEDPPTLEPVSSSFRRPSSFPVTNSITRTTATSTAAAAIKYLYLLFFDMINTP